MTREYNKAVQRGETPEQFLMGFARREPKPNFTSFQSEEGGKMAARNGEDSVVEALEKEAIKLVKLLNSTEAKRPLIMEFSGTPSLGKPWQYPCCDFS